MLNGSASISFVSPRADVEVHLPDGRVLKGPRGSLLSAFMEALPEAKDLPVMGGVVNGELRELTYPIDIDSRVRPVTASDADGARIYRRSLTFLLEAAFEDLFPEAGLTVDYSISSGGYFCQVLNRAPLSSEELKALETRMREVVQMDLPLERCTVPLAEAVEYFQKKGMNDKVRLLAYRQKEHLVLYRLEDHQDYHHGYMVPSTGYIRWFDLGFLREGFIVHFPHRQTPKQLTAVTEYPKLLSTFHEYGDWLSRLGIDYVGHLNDAIVAGRTQEIVLVSEALHEQRVAEIARRIVDRSKQSRVVLIAGPSSSGKTTFSRRLSVQLRAQGISPFPLEMDNYFVDRDQTPKDENGQLDFEAIDALNRPRLMDDLKHLIAGEEVQLPHYNFRTGLSEPGEKVRVKPDQLIILEGIHGLNPNLIPEIPTERTFRLYVSCLTQLNLDRYNRISTTDTRLVRRIVRDARERGYTAQKTIARWESVQRGEKRWIFPYQENADVIFNSALVYDLPALKTFAEPLLRQVPYTVPEYVEAKRLLAFLEWFLPVGPEMIPDNSLLREFVGRSIFSQFKLS